MSDHDAPNKFAIQNSISIESWIESVFFPIVGQFGQRLVAISIIRQSGTHAGKLLKRQWSSGALDENELSYFTSLVSKFDEQAILDDDTGAMEVKMIHALSVRSQSETFICCSRISLKGALTIGVLTVFSNLGQAPRAKSISPLLATLISDAVNSEKLTQSVAVLSESPWQQEDTEMARTKVAVRSVRTAIGCLCCIVWLADDKGKFLELKATDGNLPPRTGMDMATGEGAAGKCHELLRIIQIDDLLDEHELNEKGISSLCHPQIAKDAGWRGAVFIPLDDGGACPGVIAIYGGRPRSFSTSEIEIAIAFAQRLNSDLVRLRRKNELEAINQKLRKHAPAIEAGLMAMKHVHDINNMLFQAQNGLNDIKALLAQERSWSTHKKAEKVSEFVDRSAGMLRRMVKSAAAPERVTPTRENILKFLEEIVEPFSNDTGRKGIHFKIEGPENLIARFDRYQISHAVTNIVDNAVSFLLTDTKRAEKTVNISVSGTANHLEILIEDNGPGIQPGKELEVFTPFYTTRPGKGLGFGLWIAKGAIETHGGKIEVSSQWGYWSKFKITLPNLMS